MDWQSLVWNAQHRVNENIKKGIYPYLIPDKSCGWILHSKNKNAYLNGKKYYANSLGLRWDLEKPEILPGNNKKVLIIGDSHAHGDEVDFNECWVAKLQENCDKKYQFFNGGVPGYGIDQAFLRLQSLYGIIKPDIVLLTISFCDLYRHMTMLRFFHNPNTGTPYIKPVYCKANGVVDLIEIPESTIENFAEIFTTPKIEKILCKHDYYYKQKVGFFQRLQAKICVKILVKFAGENSSVKTLEQLISMLPNYSMQHLTIAWAIFEKYRDFCYEKKIKPLVLLFPTQNNFLKNKRYAILIHILFRKILKRLGLVCIDPQSFLQNKDFKQNKFWEPGGHMNAVASSVLAQYLANVLPEHLRG